MTQGSDAMEYRRAPALVAGMRTHVIAPSGPVRAERVDKGLRALRRNADVEVVLADNLFEHDGYFAGPDGLRAQALHRALSDPQPGVIWCARGGYGVARILARLDPQRLCRVPKVLVGFSDITALLAWWLVAGQTVSIHGPVLSQLGELHPEHVAHVFELLRGELPAPVVASEGAVLHGGVVEGRLVPGNLEVLRSLVGSPFFPPLRGNILALEEVNEAPYRIDRALTQLIASGKLRGVRGVIVGQLSLCDRPDGGVGPDAESVVLERLSTLGVPVVTGFEFGHATANNVALPFGSRVRLRADDCSVELLEPVTLAP